MHCRENRSFYQPAVSQRHEVVVAMNKVKLGSMFECFRNVKVFGYFGVNGGVFFIPPFYYGVQMSASYGIRGGKQCDTPPPSHKTFGDVARHRLPRAVL